MTYTDVWIGELAAGGDPLDWGRDWCIGNTPHRALSPCFPPSRPGKREPWSIVREGIQNGLYQGRQVDWGAWAAIMSKQDLTVLIDELYGTDPAYGPEHLCAKLAELRAAVQVLPDKGQFALVADEL